jgi:putative transposase
MASRRAGIVRFPPCATGPSAWRGPSRSDRSRGCRPHPENWIAFVEDLPGFALCCATGVKQMRKSRFSEQQIAFILRQAEEGTTVEEVCRKAGISVQTYYRWRSKYGGLMPSEMKRLKQLEEENLRLRKLVADLSLDKEMLQDVLKRKL